MLDPNTTAVLAQLGIDSGSLESLQSSFMILTAVTLLAVIPTGIIAQRKNRSKTLWVLLALSIPIVPLLVLLVLPKIAKTPTEYLPIKHHRR
jgi:hypothetical protein